MAQSAQFQREQLAILIRNLVSAAIDDSWSGGGPPEEIPVAEADLRQAQMDLREALNDLFPGTHPGDNPDKGERHAF